VTTALDSNVLIGFWDEDNTLNSLAQAALTAAWKRGTLVIAAPVYAELLAFPRRTESFLDTFLRETGITVEWEIDELCWRTAGRAFQSYAARRQQHTASGPRRILADFLIGAHALRNGYTLLTLDARLYRSAFPRLAITSV
jgi:predicted nucleic acid-binding protein